MTPLASPYTLHTTHTRLQVSMYRLMRTHPEVHFSAQMESVTPPNHISQTAHCNNLYTWLSCSSASTHVVYTNLATVPRPLLSVKPNQQVICKTDRESAFPLSSDSHQRHQTLSPAEAQLCSTDSPG